ncbi:hypothetical protein ACFO1V_03635 [Daeguia caeni]|uniref:DUF4239 domain-containing protein n=1 Tax=Daeguia caeni TaxID=439612 RepID=A0ABV9H1L8_9HYPH
MNYIFELTIGEAFLAFAGLGVVFFLAGYLVIYFLGAEARRDPSSIPIAVIVSIVATAWALSLGFAAADIWTVNADADKATSQERSAISRLLATASPGVLDAPELQKAVTLYRQAVIEDEWGRLSNVMPAASVERALVDIRREVFRLARQDLPGALASQLVQDFDELQDARNLRLAAGTTSVDTYKWYLVMALTILTSIVIGLIHADREKSGRRALIVYAITASVSLWILAIHANPYQGVGKIDSSMLYTVSRHKAPKPVETPAP